MIFDTANTALLAVVLAAVLYPLIFVASASISNPRLVATGQVYLWPKEPSLEGYRALLRYKDIWTGYRNTIFYTAAGTLLSLFLTLTAAYPLAHKDLPGRRLLL
ncbi:MAG: carbohydrate ABC transporter permease, partial [Candidatus Eisenbacteria bacterium]|nr:carbohydrate ABC transporter permease [Candidatus Eisenbacteria bacterium]